MKRSSGWFPMVTLAICSACGAQSLWQNAENAGLPIGTAVRPSLFSERLGAATLAREFRMVEAEDAIKWLTLRPDKTTYGFHESDEVVRFAQIHPMRVRGHCLVWDHNHPDWLMQGHFTSEQLSLLLHEHIDRGLKHYAGQVFVWDAVNGALDEKGEWRDSIWYNRHGFGLSEKGTLTSRRFSAGRIRRTRKRNFFTTMRKAKE